MLRSSACVGLLLAVLVGAVLLGAGNAPADPVDSPHMPGEIILKFKPTASQHDQDQVLSDLGGGKIRGLGRIKADLRRLGQDLTVEEAVARYRNHPKIQYIEPNFILQAEELPNDPRFGELWGLRNTGQTGGTAGADIRAVSAWDNFTGSDQVLIGVIDTGVDYTHPDLAANIWTNPGETPGNGIDDDGNGFIDDVHGWDFYNDDNDPMDDHGHGTHTAGTIGAVGDNGIGVVGVNWNVRILPLKFLGGGGSGSTADAIDAVQYATAMGVHLTSNSWGGGGFSQALMDAIADAGDHDILFVAAAGNSGMNTDISPHYPSSYLLDNIVSVAATDHNDQLADFSNYGVLTVDLAAPGVDILSTFPGGSYGAISGTSMATPHVSGVLGLVFGRFPAIGHLDAKALVLDSADALPNLNGVVRTGARLNAFLPTAEADSIPPGSVTDLAVGEAGSNWIVLEWSAPGDDGGTGTASRYVVKFSTAPLSEENFDAAISAADPPDPDPAGSPQVLKVRGLTFTTAYFFAVKAYDEFGNVSPVSNLAGGMTLGVPDALVEPTSLAETLVTGSTSTQSITLSNVGEGTLDFEIPAPTLVTESLPQAEYTPLAKGEIDPRVGAPAVGNSGGPDAFGYRWTDSDEPFGPTFDWIDISGTGTAVITSGDDVNVGPFPIGFPFEFYGVEYNSFRVSSNGLLSFTSSSTSYTNQPLPNSSAPLNMVAPFWDDLYITPGAVYYKSEGSRLIVQWNNIEHFDGGGPYTFQLILNAGGSIDFQYLSMSPPTESATIGIQNATGDDALQMAFNTAYVHDHLAVRIQTVPQWVSVTPVAGTVPASQSANLDVHFDPSGLLGGTYEAAVHILSNDPLDPELTVPVNLTVIGAPDIAVSPSFLDFGQVFLGVAHSASIEIANPGTDTLHVNSITVDDPVFQLSFGSVVVPPRDSRVIVVTFAPLSLGIFPATMTIAGDDPDTPITVVALVGEGVAAPVIDVSPDSLSEHLFSGGASTRVLTLSNTGGNPLTFSVSVIASLPGAVSVPFAGLVEAEPGVSNNSPPQEGASPPEGTGDFIEAAGEFEALQSSPVPLTCVVADPAERVLYGQANNGSTFYRYVAAVDTWETLANAPVFSGNNGGAALLNGKIYTTYTGNDSQLGVYDIATDTWTTRSHPLGAGTGNIASDGSTYLYLVVGSGFVRFDPVTASTTFLNPPPFYFEPWGGLRHLDGKLYGHQGNGLRGFARYDIATGSWAPLPSLPAGAVLGATIDPLGREYFAYGTYGGNNLYRYSIDSGEWSVSTVPFFSLNDGGLGWLPGPSGVYFVQGESGTGLARLVTGVPFLAVDPIRGTVPASGTLDLNVHFDATGLNGGDYLADVLIESNDPVEPTLVVPAHLSVTGAPDISLAGEPELVASTVDYLGSGVSTAHVLPVTISPSGGGSLELLAEGDYGDLSETATVTVEGTVVGSVGGVGVDCEPAADSFPLSAELLSALVADGVVRVSVQNSMAVNDFCSPNRHTVRLRYAGPADLLDFGAIFVGASRTLNLVVSNVGTDLLTVSSITVDNPAFELSDAGLSLLPGETTNLGVTFSPAAPGPETATLTLLCDDPDEGTLTFSLAGEGLIPPEIGVSPDSLSEHLFTGETSTQLLTLSNTGGSQLEFSVSVGAPAPGAVSVPFAGLSGTDPGTSDNPPPSQGAGSPEGAGDFIGAVGDFEALQSSPVPLTCVAADPVERVLYGQANNGTGFYRYVAAVDTWQTLASAPLFSGNNGGAALLNGKIYTTYTGNNSQMGVYDVATDTWSTRVHPLGAGTGNIAADGSRYLYLVVGTSFVRFDPVTASSTVLNPPPFYFEPWGGLRHLDGKLYGHQGNGLRGFARYDIATGSWTPLASLPAGGVLGATVDPLRREYYSYGTYGGTNLYRYSIDSAVWTVSTVPFFNLGDGGLGWLPTPAGVYFVQGESGTGLARLVTGVPFLTVDPITGTVPASGTLDLNVHFDAAGLNGGDYLADVLIDSNDPVEPTLVVPARLSVTGAPNIRFSTSSLAFSEVFVGGSTELPLLVENVGSDLLSVSSVASALPDYIPDVGSFTLLPGQGRTMEIRFQPIADGDRTTTLVFTSNDPRSPHAVSLTGVGVLPPVITAVPDTVVGAALPGGTKTKTLRVCNTGGSDLSFFVAAPSFPPPPPPGPKIAVHVKSHASKAGLICLPAEDGGLAPTNLPCSEYVSQAPTLAGRDVYVVATGMDPDEGVLGLSWGIAYDAITGSGVDLYSWTFCGDGLQFPSDTWPASGAGNRMTWVTCQDRELPPDGVHAIAGAFYVYAYSADTFRITENIPLNTGPELEYANCAGAEVTIPVTAIGSARFSSTGLQPGFNPCLAGASVYEEEEKAKETEDKRIGYPVLHGAGGPDDYGYRWKDSDEPGGPIFSWTDISATGTPAPIAGDDHNVGPFPIGFDFDFYGVPFDQFRICTNGWISFTSSSSQFGNQPLPAVFAPENLVAAFWDDLYLDPNRVFYAGDGYRLIVQFQNVRLDFGSGTYTFQIILEASGDIVFQYLDMNGSVTGATVGIQNGTRNDGLTVAFNTAYLHDHLAVRFSTLPNWLTVEPLAGTVSPGQCLDVSMIMDARGLQAGTYETDIGLSSNDPVTPSMTRHVVLRVGSVGVADFDVDPNTLNLGSNGRWVAAYVEIPVAYAPQDVLASTVRLNDAVPADVDHVDLGDFNQNGITDLGFKFDRTETESILGEGDSVEVRVTGEIEDTIYFTGTDYIRIIRPRLQAPNGGETLLAGSRVQIRWINPEGWDVESATLIYSADDGATWSLIAEGVSGDSFTWAVPSLPTDRGRIQVHVFDELGVLGHDGSDRTFAITTQTTGVEDAFPLAYALFQNVPNPFSGSSRITFDLPADSRVVLSIFDISGRFVRRLENGWLPAGRHQASWDGRDEEGRDVGSGVYFYRIEAGEFSARRSMSLTR